MIAAFLDNDAFAAGAGDIGVGHATKAFGQINAVVAARFDHQVFGPLADQHVLTVLGRSRLGHGCAKPFGRHAVALHLARNEVHGRRADEACNKLVIRITVKVHWCANLFDAAQAQNNDLVSKRHRLDLIVGYVDHRRADFLVQARDFDPHLDPQFGVEIGEWFVEQEHLGATDNRATNGNPLALTAGQGGRLALEVFIELENAACLRDLFLDLAGRVAVHFQTEAHVFLYGHVRVERVGLEHHGHAAVRRIKPCHVTRADIDLALGGFLKPGHHSQQRGFAAP